MFVNPTFGISIVLSFSWELKRPREKLSDAVDKLDLNRFIWSRLMVRDDTRREISEVREHERLGEKTPEISNYYSISVRIPLVLLSGSRHTYYKNNL